MKAPNTKKSDDVGMCISIPEEIMEEILAKLGAKPLSRFKCVSKSWLSLIDSKSFIHKHLRNSERNRSSLIDRNSIFFNKQLRNNKPATEKILGCFNGVLCLLKQGRFVFSNPAIRISNKLPKLSLFCTEHLLGLDRVRWYAQVKCGFGWDEENHAYKVFVSIFGYPRRDFLGKLYSSKTNSWKTVACGRICSGHRIFGDYINVGVFAYGKIHWISKRREKSCVEYFDLKSEVFGMVYLPSQPQSRVGGIWSLRESRGCLYALYYDPDRGLDDGDGRPLFDVWVMEVYGVKESWVKKCTIPISFDKIEYPNSYNMYDEENISPYYQPHYVYVESLVSPICDIKGYRGESDSDDKSDE